jgi:hypothetical protein
LRNRKRKIVESSCPICYKIIANEDIQIHVDLCLRKQDNSDESDDDDEIDVGESYSWCGQTRIRATTLIEGSLSSAGIGTCITKTNESEDEHVNILDEDNTFGTAQYSERDIILLNKEDEHLRDLVADSQMPSTSNAQNSRENDTQEVSSTSSSPISFIDSSLMDAMPLESSNQQMIIESLKAKIREYEHLIRNRPKCLICLSPNFENPVVSVMCWHVYCEKCWLHTLGAKKLCPQCMMICSASDLRRIYL